MHGSLNRHATCRQVESPAGGRSRTSLVSISRWLRRGPRTIRGNWIARDFPCKQLMTHFSSFCLPPTSMESEKCQCCLVNAAMCDFSGVCRVRVCVYSQGIVFPWNILILSFILRKAYTQVSEIRKKMYENCSPSVGTACSLLCMRFLALYTIIFITRNCNIVLHCNSLFL